MTPFREFEIKAIRLMTEAALAGELLQSVISDAEVVGYEYTGCGYFLTVKHAALPLEKKTLHVPAVVGTAGDVQAGFLVFLGDGQLTLECHTWGPVEVPEDFRDQDVAIESFLFKRERKWWQFWR
jgi:hypothetical protein